MNTTPSSLSLALLITAGLAATGCESSPAGTSQGAITTTVYSDLPSFELDSQGAISVDLDGHAVSGIWLDVARVEINGERGWTTLTEWPGAFDLLALSGDISAALGHVVLPAGDYEQIRLVLTGDNRIIIDGQSLPLTVPSGEQSGLKLNRPFTVPGGAVIGLELDFDIERSVHVTGNGEWKLQPTIGVRVVETDSDEVHAVAVQAGDDALLALSDGAVVEIPAGAITVDTEVWFVRFPRAGGEPQLSEWYGLAPMDVELSAAAIIELPYNRDALASGVAESELFIDSDAGPLSGTAVIPQDTLVHAELRSFGAFRVRAPQE